MRMSTARVPPMIGPVLASDIDHDLKLAVGRGRVGVVGGRGGGRKDLGI